MTFKRRTFSREQSALECNVDNISPRKQPKNVSRRSTRSKGKSWFWTKGLWTAVAMYTAWRSAIRGKLFSRTLEEDCTSYFDEIGAAGRRLVDAMKKTSEMRFSFGELVSLKSRWDLHRDKREASTADVTAILLDSPSLRHQLGALMVSTMSLQEIWVILPGAESAGSRVVEKFRAKSPFGKRLHVIKSDLFFADGEQLSLREGLVRYQLALQAKTDYIWILDPGVVPGRQYLSLLAHVSGSSEVQGALGGAGWLLPASASRWWSTEGTDVQVAEPSVFWDDEILGAVDGGEDSAGTGDMPPEVAAALGMAAVEVGGIDTDRAPPVLFPVDLLQSQWFVHKDMIRLLFRERWPMESHSEALAFSYSLRKFGGMESYVLPYDPDFPEFMSDVGIAGLPDLYAAATAEKQQSEDPLTGRQRDSKPFLRKRERRGFAKAEGRGLEEDGLRSSAEGRGLEEDGLRSSAEEAGGRRLLGVRGADGGDGRNEDAEGQDILARNAGRLLGKRGLTEGVSPAGPSPTLRATPKTGQPLHSSVLGSALRLEGLKRQFWELTTRGGRWFWMPAQYPRELVMLVVHGEEQAKVFRPLYEEMVRSVESQAAGDGGGVDVVVAVITEGYEAGTSRAETVRPECRDLAAALGLSPKTVRRGSDGQAGLHPRATRPPGASRLIREAPEPRPSGSSTKPERREAEDREHAGANGLRGARRFLRVGPWEGYGERWRELERTAWKAFGAGGDGGRGGFRSNYALTQDELCLGEASGVFHIRVGQDYPRAPGRPLDPYLDAFQGLSGVLNLVEPTAVAYVKSEHGAAEASGAGLVGLTTRDGTRSAVAAAVEAAVRGRPSPPISVRLSDAEESAAAAKALVHLPEGSLERWRKASVVIVLVHPHDGTAAMLQMTMSALKQAYFLGDDVELRVVLHESSVGVAEVRDAVRRPEWTSGPFDVSYFSGQDRGSASSLPTSASLEAFSDTGVHKYVIPLVSGARPAPEFYLWLKVALINEGYATKPLGNQAPTDDQGSSGSSPRGDTSGSSPVSGGAGRRAVSVALSAGSVGEEMALGEEGAGARASARARAEGLVDVPRGDGVDAEGVRGGVPGMGKGERRLRDRPDGGRREGSRERGGGGRALVPGDEDEVEGVGRGSALAFSVSARQGSCSRRRRCSKVWMYGSAAWDRLRQRCRRDAECVLWGGAVAHGDLTRRHVSGAGPATGGWERVTVWDPSALAATR